MSSYIMGKWPRGCAAFSVDALTTRRGVSIVGSQCFPLLSTAIAAILCAAGSVQPASAQTVPAGVTIDPVKNDVPVGPATTPTWDLAGGQLIVGDNASGEVTVGDGGSLLNGNAFLGLNAGDGRVIVEGGTWTSTGQVQIGSHGNGTLDIREGGVVYSSFGIVGTDKTSTAIATVAGPGASWTNDNLYIAYDGVGTLNIGAGGVVSSAISGIAAFAGSVGHGSVDGAGAVWTNSDEFHIGWGGTGDLTIANGGRVTNTKGTIGEDAIAIGMVLVSGSDGLGNASTWINNGDLLVGGSGQGALTIENGGIVTSELGYIANDAGSEGEVFVSGVGANGAASTWDSIFGIRVGEFGTGALSISNGARVTTGLVSHIGNEAGSRGTVIVSGQDAAGNAASWITSDDIAVGQWGTGFLTIENGGFVSNRYTSIGGEAGSQGEVIVTGRGANGVPSAWDITSSLYIGDFGSGALTVDDGAIVRVSDVAYVGNDSGASGSLTLLGDASARGVVETNAVVRGLGTAGINLDGGILRAMSSRTNFLDGFNALVGSEGAWFDTNGHGIGVSSTFNGASTFNKLGLGTLTLTGNSSAFTGVANVLAGTLLIGDVGSAATFGGNVDVASGATLGGIGTVGGSVAVAGGGVLSPGGSTTPGTLTIQGDLSLSSTSLLDFRLGQAGTVGGALNDLIVVDGDLTLDGAVNVATSAGGAFGPGVYRLINYSGSLTDRGLLTGILPPGGPTGVQVSIAQQVNLVNSAGPFDFWDGPQGAGWDGSIYGGDGTWQAGGPYVWADAAGDANGGFADGTFAIFAAMPGTVTVDDSAGPVVVSGMQFASDGYRITGDAITLQAGEAIIRVGDGTAASADFAATLASALTGPGALNKTDPGTLILSGANSYTGGTTISAGTLQVGDGGTTGVLPGDVNIAGTLAFNRSDSWTFGGSIQGTGAIRQIGQGATILTADSSAFGGRALVDSGTLEVAGILGGTMDVFAGARLAGAGQVGVTTNRGTIAPGHDGFGALTIAGDYTGSGGLLEIEAALGDDASQTDRLIVTGATAGDTRVTVTNLNGGGSQTQRGIQVVQVNGRSQGQFTLTNEDYWVGAQPAVVAGAYGYVLQQDDADGNWYLRSSLLAAAGPDVADGDTPLYQPGLPLYEAYADMILSMSDISTLRQRVGERRYADIDPQRPDIWLRMKGQSSHFEAPVSASAVQQDIDSWKAQLGVEGVVSAGEDGARLMAGMSAHFGAADASLESAYGGGLIETKAYGLGVTVTRYGQDGDYIDAQAELGWFESDLRSDIVGRIATDRVARSYGVSLEVGKAFAAGDDLSVTPQAQLSYASTNFDDFVDPFDAHVADDRGESLQARLGVALDHARDWQGPTGQNRARLYGLLNLKYELLDGSRLRVSGTPFDIRQRRAWGGLGLGATHSWADSRYALHAEASADTSIRDFGDSYALSANLGLRAKF